MKSPPATGQLYVALIADMVGSRTITRPHREPVQARFHALVQSLNKRYSRAIASRFVITLGDEFQGLLHRASVLPDLMWDIEQNFSERQIRIGIGFGAIHTAIPKYAINLDGPSLHCAREAIEIAKAKSVLGGIFVGFPCLDNVLNGSARMLWFHRAGWTAQQRKIAAYLRDGISQSQISEKLRISKQAISKHSSAAGASVYLEGEQAFRSLLENFIDPKLKVGPREHAA